MGSKPADQKHVTSHYHIYYYCLTHICVVSPVLEQKILYNSNTQKTLKYLLKAFLYKRKFSPIKLFWIYISFCWGFNYMTLRKSGGRFPCNSVKVVQKLRTVLSFNSNKKRPIFLTIPYYFGNFFLISYSSGDIPLSATFKYHQQTTIHSTKHFLKNVWNDFRKCDTKFIFKRGAQNYMVLKLVSLDFRDKVLGLDTFAFSEC